MITQMTPSLLIFCQLGDWQFRLCFITENRRLPAVTFAAGYMIAAVFIERRGHSVSGKKFCYNN